MFLFSITESSRKTVEESFGVMGVDFLLQSFYEEIEKTLKPISKNLK